MKPFRIFFMALMNLLIISSSTFGGDFDWARDINLVAKADPLAFRARLEARFKIGDIDVKAVLDNVEKPSDAYILFRLGEISNRPIDYVMRKYKSEKGNGWGSLARSLGIKPGSSEFHALKQGQNLFDDKSRGKDNKKGKGKGKKRK